MITKLINHLCSNLYESSRDYLKKSGKCASYQILVDNSISLLNYETSTNSKICTYYKYD